MRKIIALILAIMFVVSMAVNAYAVTPHLNIPSIKVPDISSSVEVKLSDGFWDNYFVANPIKLPTDFKLPDDFKFDFDFKFN